MGKIKSDFDQYDVVKRSITNMLLPYSEFSMQRIIFNCDHNINIAAGADAIKYTDHKGLSIGAMPNIATAKVVYYGKISGYYMPFNLPVDPYTISLGVMTLNNWGSELHMYMACIRSGSNPLVAANHIGGFYKSEMNMIFTAWVISLQNEAAGSLAGTYHYSFDGWIINLV